jgi:hypothetical protein
MKNGNFTICPFVNELSDHSAQLLTLMNVSIHNQIHDIRTIRKINKYSIVEFMTNLSDESWDNVDTVFNNFLNTYGFFILVFL